jgi:hypothetical protein
VWFRTLDKPGNDDGRVINCLQDYKDELVVRHRPRIARL